MSDEVYLRSLLTAEGPNEWVASISGGGAVRWIRTHIKSKTQPKYMRSIVENTQLQQYLLSLLYAPLIAVVWEQEVVVCDL